MLKVGSLEVEKGKKKSGYFQVGERAIGTVDLPVTLIHGAKKGPTFSMTAGFHPREYAGIDSVTRIAKMVDPNKISGNLILVHIANVPAFIERGRENPVDLLHPTNCFPGDPNGTLSHRIAYALAKEVIDQSDYYMDHHSGDVQ